MGTALLLEAQLGNRAQTRLSARGPWPGSPGQCITCLTPETTLISPTSDMSLVALGSFFLLLGVQLSLSPAETITPIIKLPPLSPFFRRPVHAKLLQSCLTLRSHGLQHQAPLSKGFSRQEHRNGLPFSSPGDLPDARIKPTALMSPALAGTFFTTRATWEALSF